MYDDVQLGGQIACITGVVGEGTTSMARLGRTMGIGDESLGRPRRRRSHVIMVSDRGGLEIKFEGVKAGLSGWLGAWESRARLEGCFVTLHVLPTHTFRG